MVSAEWRTQWCGSHVGRSTRWNGRNGVRRIGRSLFKEFFNLKPTENHRENGIIIVVIVRIENQIRSRRIEPTASTLAWPATMRIEALSTLVAVVWLTAVLCPRLAAANNLTLSLSSTRRPREHPFRGHITRWTIPSEDTSSKRMTYREMQMVLRQEGGEDGLPVDCCPTIEEMVEPVGGRNHQDMYVELYRDGENAQRFFEYSCRPDVLDRPCRFIDRKLSNQSRCVQKFSYTYAIVANPKSSKITPEEHRRHHHREHRFPAFPGSTESGSTWTLDYIKVRSGCSCEIMPKPKKKKAVAKLKKFKSKSRQSRDQDSDWET